MVAVFSCVLITNMRGHFWKIKKLRGARLLPTGITRENLKIIKGMALGNTFGEMGKPTQGNGKMVSNVGQAYGNQEKETVT